MPELTQRNADNLHTKLSEINATNELVQRLQTAEQLRVWVAEAKTLPRVIAC